MAVNRILYFYLLLLSFLFYVLFDVYLLHLFFIFLLLLPILSLLVALPLRYAIFCRMEPTDDIVVKGGCALAFTAENRGILPCACVRIRLRYVSRLGRVGAHYPEDIADLVQFPLGARQKLSLRPDVKTLCCGRVDFTMTDVSVFDLLGLVRLPVPKRNLLADTASVFILPAPQTRVIDTEDAADLGLDSATYSTSKPGGDPSEIFQLRDYREGDPRHSVHRRLSARMQRIIVRDFGLPLNPSLHFLLELPADTKPAAAEYMLGTALAFFENLMAREIVHHVSWLHDDGLIHTVSITGADALAGAMHELLSLPGQKRWDTLRAFTEQTAPQPETHLLCLTAGICPPPDEAASQLLSRIPELCFCRKLTLMPGRVTPETAAALQSLGCEVQLLNGHAPDTETEATAL